MKIKKTKTHTKFKTKRRKKTLPKPIKTDKIFIVKQTSTFFFNVILVVQFGSIVFNSVLKYVGAKNNTIAV